MIDTSVPRASNAWLATWPKRPQPITSAVPERFSARSMPSKDCVSMRTIRSATTASSGVSAIEMITAALRGAASFGVKIAAPAAAG